MKPDDWVRIMRLTGYGNNKTGARLISLDGDYAIVQPIGHRKTERISVSLLKPWAARNGARHRTGSK